MASRFLRRLAPLHCGPAINSVRCRFNSSLSDGSSEESTVDVRKEASSVPEFVSAPDSRSLAVLEDLRARGLSALETQEVTNLFAQGKRIIAYGGIDPTADCLHVGHLMLLMTLLRLHAAGHDIIVVIGGATAVIGDPSDQVKDRAPMDKETISKNVHALTMWVTEFLERNRRSPASIRVLNNADWYQDFKLMDFFEEFGRHTRMSTLLGREFVDQRLRNGIGLSYTEFSYQLFQAVDFYHLHKNYDVNLQLGGSDQWGNILTGTDLIKKKTGGSVHGITMPLVTNAHGKKVGKTAGVPVWLDHSKTTPFQLYQHFLRTEDSKVDEYLHLFTFVPVAEVRQMAKEHQTARDGWIRQKRLGKDVVEIVHGPDCLSVALEATEILYAKEFKAHLLTEEMLEMLFEELPSKELPMSALKDIDMTRFARVLKLKKGDTIADINKSLKEGKIRLNGKHVNEATDLRDVGLLHQKYTLVHRGKRNYILVRWNKDLGNTADSSDEKKES